MTFRRVLTVSLLLFVAAAVVTLVGKELSGRSSSNAPYAPQSREALASGRQVVACYFVGKVRCSSCRNIEDVSRKTIEGSFPQELADGRLRFLVVDADLPENRRFVEEFRLESSSLVLVEMREGKPAAWKNLPQVWTLVENEDRLGQHVRDEVSAMLKGT